MINSHMLFEYNVCWSLSRI